MNFREERTAKADEGGGEAATTLHLLSPASSCYKHSCRETLLTAKKENCTDIPPAARVTFTRTIESKSS